MYSDAKFSVNSDFAIKRILKLSSDWAIDIQRQMTPRWPPNDPQRTYYPWSKSEVLRSHLYRDVIMRFDRNDLVRHLRHFLILQEIPTFQMPLKRLASGVFYCKKCALETIWDTLRFCQNSPHFKCLSSGVFKCKKCAPETIWDAFLLYKNSKLVNLQFVSLLKMESWAPRIKNYGKRAKYPMWPQFQKHQSECFVQYLCNYQTDHLL